MAVTVVWRAMNSLLVLRDQCDEIAPLRAKGADGLVGDEAHQGTNSDHNPHYVPGVGANIVTALDLTHDPAGGFDSYEFAETLRLRRDKRIKYVISNRQIFSSYAVTVNGITYAPFTWRPYSGTDPHTGHVHISVLDAVISDTSTPWNLDGFGDDMTPGQGYILERILNYRVDAIRNMTVDYTIPAYSNSGSNWNARPEHNTLAEVLLAMQADVAEIKAKLQSGTGGGAGDDDTEVLAAIEAVDQKVGKLIKGIQDNAAAVTA